MKKMIAWILALTMVFSIALVSASAETEGAAEAAPSTMAQSARGNQPGQGGGPMGGPRNNDRRGGGQQPPQMPGDGQQQPPQMPGNDRQSPNGPQMNGNGQQDANAPQQPNGDQQAPGAPQAPDQGRVDFETLLKNGVITQEVYDSIMKYMQENAPQQPAAPGNAGADNSQATPEQPAAGEKPADLPEPPADGEGGLLKDLLSAGVITQEAYDAIAAAQTAQSGEAEN